MSGMNRLRVGACRIYLEEEGMAQVTEVVKLRRSVLSEIARLAYAGELQEHIQEIPHTVVTEEGPRYRCCVHKERAVLNERINSALSQPICADIAANVEQALAGSITDTPVISVLPEACDRCPIDKFLVTDACRNCIAHHCIAACPKKAIMVVQNQAYIDKTKCVECGLCKKSCPYGAIIEISRPCERACELKAITAGADRRAVIDYDKCVQCGACKVSCPFGAISDRSQIVQIIQQIRHNKPVYAVVAPAVVGQYGLKIRPGQIFSAIRQLGFQQVREVALGADIVTLEETKEFVSRREAGELFMTTSCCPAFVGMVDKHMPELKSHVSTTVSPMVAVAKVIKAEDPEAIVVFIGPCIAKKAEALNYPGTIDYVLTFDELGAMFTGKDIDLAAMADDYSGESSRDSYQFARTGGVLAAVLNTAKELAPAMEVAAHRSEGLAACVTELKQIKSGKIAANLMEGMACMGGCVGGPGTIGDVRVTSRLVEQFAGGLEAKVSVNNPVAMDKLNQGGHWHVGQKVE